MTTRFLVAGTVALAGIVVMAGAVAALRDLDGVLAALVMTACFAMQSVHTKRHPTLNMTILSRLAAAVCVPVCAPFMQFQIPALSEIVACARYGVLTSGLAYVLVVKGGGLISSGEAGFISMLDVVLGPLWVWLFSAERPTVAVIGGGFIVLFSVAWYLSTNRAPDAQTS